MWRIAGLLAFAVLAALPARDGLAESDGFNLQLFHPFTMAFGGCGPETGHTYFLIFFLGNCDPVNLLFDDMGEAEVVTALQSRGWTAFGLGSPQFLHFDIEEIPLLPGVQLYKWLLPGQEGCPPDVELCRYHMRLWRLPEGRGVAGAAHYEEGGFFVHELRQSWEYAEAEVCSDIASVAGFSCQPNAVSLAAQAAIQGGPTWRAAGGFSGVNDTLASLVKGPDGD